MAPRGERWRGAAPTVRLIALLVMALAVATQLVSLSAPAALAAPVPLAARPALAATRPPYSVAYARVAVARVLTYYNGMVNNDPAPIPDLNPCVGDGVIVGVKGNGLNSFNYLLTPTQAVNPITACQGAQTAFAQLNGQASGWTIWHIDVLLNVAYTGAGDTQQGTVRFSIDPSLISTNGGAAGPQLLLLPLSNVGDSPTHDLPVLSTPLPSDAPATGDPNVLDLTSYPGQPLARDAVPPSEVKTTLYPIALGANALGLSAPKTGAAATERSALSPAQLALGAPEVDSNGRLIGMIVPDAQGNHTLASLQTIRDTIGSVTGRSGPLMTRWQQGLNAFYASPPQYTQATDAFTQLQANDKDFAGVAPFGDAARQQSPSVPSLTQEATPAATTPATPPQRQSALSPTLLAAVAGAVIALLIVIVAVGVALARRRARVASAPAIPPEEAMLDLLPRDLPLDQIDQVASPTHIDQLETLKTPALPGAVALEDEPTRPLPITSRPTNPPALNKSIAREIEQETTLRLPALAFPSTPLARKGAHLALTPHAAGVTDPGIKRSGEPNQDNILALQGIRLADGRLQPYGLFIVADGMGGHLNGQEASRLTIEVVATTALQTLMTSQPLDDRTLERLLPEGAHRAAAELQRHNMENRADMGTTITAALVVDDVAFVANVGDSRTYLLSPEVGLRQITTDHSVVASLVSAGVIRPDDVYTHPRRNQIYRSLGGEHEDVEVDTFEVPLQAGDKLLLCSDGLWEMVRNPQIEHILRATADPAQAAELLAREANVNGGEDNVSVIVVRLLEDMPLDAQPGVNVLIAPPDLSVPVAR